MWQRGDVVVVRYELRGFAAGGGFGRVMPLSVIEHTDTQLVAYLAEGTEMVASRLADGRELREVPLEERWAHPRQSVRRAWQGTDIVMIFPSGREHSFWVFHENGRHTGWYVNLEAPHTVGDRTITTVDGILDVWIPVETGMPVWKDEDAFEAAQRVGRLTSAEAVALRAEGERVIAEHPWPTGWENWRPPEGWEAPRLPPGWDTSQEVV
jgi:Protein of unknown function (DUF402)